MSNTKSTETKTSRVRKNCKLISSQKDDNEEFAKQVARVLFKTQERFVVMEQINSGETVLLSIDKKYFLILDYGVWELYEFIKPE